MNEQQEKLSGLLDEWKGDADEQTLLDQVLADVNERARLQRYQMIGEVMRHELPRQIRPDFAAGVMARIEQEGVVPEGTPAPARRGRRAEAPWWLSWLKPAAGLSVAAAVAFVAVTTVTQTRLQPAGSPQVVASAATVAAPADSDPRIEQLANLPVLAPSVKVAAGPAVTTEQPVERLEVRRDTAAVRRKLNGYLVDHNQYAGSLQGIIPQVRVVATGARN
jgi:negative regulator of sigma E activity